MATLDRRLTDLERKHSGSDLRGMTADQLYARLETLTPGTLEWFGVMLAGIWRKGSRLPISTAR